jgi:hypothetical protein
MLGLRTNDEIPKIDRWESTNLFIYVRYGALTTLAESAFCVTVLDTMIPS